MPSPPLIAAVAAFAEPGGPFEPSDAPFVRRDSALAAATLTDIDALLEVAWSPPDDLPADLTAPEWAAAILDTLAELGRRDAALARHLAERAGGGSDMALEALAFVGDPAALPVLARLAAAPATLDESGQLALVWALRAVGAPGADQLRALGARLGAAASPAVRGALDAAQAGGGRLPTQRDIAEDAAEAVSAAFPENPFVGREGGKGA